MLTGGGRRTWVGGQMQGVNVAPFLFAFGLKNQLKD